MYHFLKKNWLWSPWLLNVRVQVVIAPVGVASPPSLSHQNALISLDNLAPAVTVVTGNSIGSMLVDNNNLLGMVWLVINEYSYSGL